MRKPIGQKEWSKLAYFLIGAAVIELVLKKRNSSAPTSDEPSSPGLFSKITQGITNLLDKKSAFVAKMTPIADLILKRYNIHPLITMTQAAEESNWGTSKLAVQDNNLYGFIASPAWISSGNAYQDWPTTEYSPKPPEQIKYFETPGDLISVAPGDNGGSVLKVHRFFRKYPTWYDSAADWARNIATRALYAGAYTFAQAGDMENFAYAVAQAGYATDPQYAETLIAFGKQVQAARNATV